MQRSRSTLLSPPCWTIAMHSSSIYGTTSKSIQKPQYIQNSPDRILMGGAEIHSLPYSKHSTGSLSHSILNITHQFLHGPAATYLKDLLTLHTSSRSLRSSSSYLIKTQTTKLHTMGGASLLFCCFPPLECPTIPSEGNADCGQL